MIKMMIGIGDAVPQAVDDFLLGRRNRLYVGAHEWTLRRITSQPWAEPGAGIEFSPLRLDIHGRTAEFDSKAGMFILDTNVISEVRRWDAEQSTGRLFLSLITILELEKAFWRWSGACHRKPRRILPFTDDAATIYAALHVPDPRSERDSMIAATAI